VKVSDRIKWYTQTVYVKSMLALGALNRGSFRKAARLLKREEGQGTLEYVMLLSGVALVLVVIYGIFTSIRTRAERTQQAIDNLPSP